MRARTLGTILTSLISLFSLSIASSAGAQKPGKKTLPPPPQPEPVAAPAAPAELPAPILVDVPPPPVAATNRDKNEAKPEADDDDPPNAGPGFVGGVRFSGEVLVGEAEESSSISAGFSSISGAAGYYFTDHVGALVGLKFGFGAAFECPTTCTTASTWQIPVTLQYAFQDRTRGAYLEGGLGLLSGVHMNLKGADANLELTTPVEAKLGAGYRWKSQQGKVTQATLLYAGVDVGEYSSFTVSAGDRRVAGDIASKAMHVSFSAGVGFQF